MNSDPFTGFFGFTESETKQVLKDCELEDKEAIVKEWYDGYKL